MANKVLEYFYQIMSIPRCSGNENKIVEFLKNFAISNHLEYMVDENKNILIKKNTSKKKPLILQAHTDMVCVAENDFDFNLMPILPFLDGNFLRAKGTTLGADNGIGLCMALSILQEDFPMNIEVVFTSEEETTMNGAKSFDTFLLKGKHFLSLDGSKESVIDIASASVLSTVFSLPNSLVEDVKDNLFSISVSGLIGGHSGEDIDKNRGNSFKILFEFLKLLQDIQFVSLDAKEKDNVIPTHCSAIIQTKLTREQIEKELENFYFETFNSIYAPKLKIEVQEEKAQPNQKVYLNSAKLLKFLNKLPYGVIEEDQDGTVMVSANLHKVDLTESKVYLSIRGGSKDQEKAYVYDLQMLSNAYEYDFKPLKYLPAFFQNKNSILTPLLVKTHKEIYGNEPKIQKIHAGLEAGIFAEKMPDLDVCVIAPNIYDLHSTSEKVDLDSVDRTYQWLKAIVKQF